MYSLMTDNLAVHRFPNIALGRPILCEILFAGSVLGENCVNSSATNFCDEAIYLTGGWIHIGEPIRAVNKYDLNLNEWLPNQPQLNEARAYHASCTLNRRAYVIGGWRKDRNLDSVESTDGPSVAWYRRAAPFFLASRLRLLG